MLSFNFSVNEQASGDIQDDLNVKIFYVNILRAWSEIQRAFVLGEM